MPGTPEDEVLLTLHRASAARQPWNAFLEKLCELLDLGYANLIFRREGARSVDAEFSAGTSVTSDLKQRYREGIMAFDPLPYHTMTPGRIYRLSDLLTTDSVASHPFYHMFLEPAGLSHLLTARIVEEGGHTAWISVARNSRQCGFSVEEIDLCQRLLPHLAVALHTFLVIDRHRVQAAIGRHVSACFDTAAITLTSRGKVLGMGPMATEVLASTDALDVRADGHLGIRDRLLHKRFIETIATVLATRHSLPLLLETREGQIELLVAPFLPEITQGVARPDVVLYLRRDHHARASENVRNNLAVMFGLTPTEVDIAIRLADGQTMAAVACDLKLSILTVRSYSKPIYAKLGVRRQVDLVRRLLSSIAHLA